jgi:hypothetical protein
VRLRRERSQRLARLRLGAGVSKSLELPCTESKGARRARAARAVRRGGAGSAAALCELELASGRVRELARAFDEALDPDDVTTPEAIRFASADGREAHAFLYRPKSARFEGPAGARPPLVVKSHGGPTGATSPSLRLAHQFWTSRGFALVDVNYGGSTGYGRAYRDLLHERWGIVDVEDCAHAALYLAAQGLVDPARLVATGGSAGGYTTLCLLTFATSSRPARATTASATSRRSRARPTSSRRATRTGWWGRGRRRAPAIARARPPPRRAPPPVIFFQGLKIRAAGAGRGDGGARRAASRTRRVLLEEGHGFRRAETIERALEAELWFYGRVLGFAVDSAPDPLPELR